MTRIALQYDQYIVIIIIIIIIVWLVRCCLYLAEDCQLLTDIDRYRFCRWRNAVQLE